MDVKELARLLSLPRLPDYISRLEAELLTSAPSLALLRDPALRTLNSGGKRFRPALVFTAASLNGDMDERAVLAAAAVELAHQSSLVHDDVIDKSATRNGWPSVVAKEGLEIAVLLGDYFLSKAFELAGSVGKEIAAVLSQAVSDMSVGQALELAENYRKDPAGADYRQAARLKTGALISAACRIGGLCANLAAADVKKLGKYGELFGLGYQLADDIADGDLVGKPAAAAKAAAEKFAAAAAETVGSIPGDTAGLANLPAHILKYRLGI